MKILFGDIHNHCGMTYGFGGLKNALDNAKSHLDFCAVTGHAFWPDMPPRTKETEFIVKFHTDGFNKLKKNYVSSNELIKSYNDENNFTTFYSYEMHSAKYGDHHLVSGDDKIPLVEANSPTEWWDKVKGYDDTILIPHHIAYTPNYRGISWDDYRDDLFPVVEVCSKHGVSMSDKHPNDYYHTMGGRDSRNTVFSGLEKGKRFGFVGSTDHHAGYPGSYGDCCLAVLAETNSRHDIMSAIKARRTYALTGDKIKCNFTVDDKQIGSINKFEQGKKTLKYNVELSHFLNKIVIYKGLKPIKVINGEFIDDQKTSAEFKVRFEFGWGGSKDLYPWKFNCKVENGKVLDIEKCFRGVSVLAPREGVEISDSVNIINNFAKIVSDNEVIGEVDTVANYTTTSPATSAVILKIKGDLTTKIKLEANGKIIEHSIAELLKSSFTEEMGITNGRCFKMHLAVPQTQFEINGEFEDVMTEKGFYFMEVYQTNGSCAFVTPIYFE